jgi:DNA polymerase III subunit alpha
MFAYVTVEDETGSIEMMAFSSVLSRCGNFLHDDSAIIVKGRLTIREDRPPQIMCDEIEPLENLVSIDDKTQKLFIKLRSEDDPLYLRIKALIHFLQGGMQVTLFFEDTKKQVGCLCSDDARTVAAIREIVGDDNAVFK